MYLVYVFSVSRLFRHFAIKMNVLNFIFFSFFLILSIHSVMCSFTFYSNILFFLFGYKKKFLPNLLYQICELFLVKYTIHGSICIVETLSNTGTGNLSRNLCFRKPHTDSFFLHKSSYVITRTIASR